LTCVCICQQGQTLNEKEADLDFLENALLFAHPSAGRYTSKETIIDHLDKLKEHVRSDMLSIPFRFEVARIVAQMKCVHTSVLRGKRTTRKSIRKNGLPRIMPIRFYFDGNDLWVVESLFDSLKIIEGMRIDSLDHRPINEVVNEMMHYRSGDGYSPTFMKSILNWNVNFSNLYKNYFEPDTFVTAFLSGKGKQMHISIPYARTVMPLEPIPEQNVIFETPNHRFWMDSTTEACILEIASFNPQKKVNRFYRQVFEYLDTHNVDNLVIDLRGNSGGNIKEAERLLGYTVDTTVFYTLEKSRSALWRYTTFMSNYMAFMNFLKRKVLSFARRYKKDGLFILEQKNKVQKRYLFDGQIYVIQDGFTASSASFVSTYLKQHSDAIIIGSESGGGAAGNNGLLYATTKLPHSKIKIRMPQYWLNYHLLPDAGRGVLPDFPTYYSIADVMEKNDLEMETARRLILRASED
jgi:C-terminal processing protease CtpA/Prc